MCEDFDARLRAQEAPMLTVTQNHQDGIAILTLNRPAKLNALNHVMRQRLMTLLDGLRESQMVRSIVIIGAGERAFSAGADITEIDQASREGNALQDVVIHGQAMTAMIENYPKPVVAAVNGIAYGGGCEIVEACHLAVAADTARFAKPEISLGMPPSFGGTQRLPRLVGRRRGLEHLLTGDPFDASQAMAEGLVNAIVPAPMVMSRAIALAKRVARHSPEAVRAVLAAVANGIHLPMAEALSIEQREFAGICGTASHLGEMEKWLRRER
jgi:enoyl-CoA hydratase